jgi:uncharacterized membrane protein
MLTVIIVVLALGGIISSCCWVARQPWPWYGKAFGMLAAVVFGVVMGAFLLLLLWSEGWERQERRGL